MARIELRNATIRLKDGFSNGDFTPEVDGVTAMGAASIPLRGYAGKVPVGARLTIAGDTTKYVVTARVLSAGVNEQQTIAIDDLTSSGTFTLSFNGQVTGTIAWNADAATVQAALEGLSNIAVGDVLVAGGPGPGTDWVVTFQGSLQQSDVSALVGDGSLLVGGSTTVTVTETLKGRAVDETTQITVSPVLAAMAADGADITFAPQELEIKVGDGDLNYTENDEFIYDLDRGVIDGVRQGDDQPMEVSMNFVYEHITTGTGETIAPMDAIKRRGGAAEWVNAAADPCEPYAIDIVIEHIPPCGTSQIETTTFPDFRSEQREVNFRDANISITGRCNAVEPIVERSDAA